MLRIAFCLTVTAIALTESFSQLPGAVVAFLAAHCIFKLDSGQA